MRALLSLLAAALLGLTMIATAPAAAQEQPGKKRGVRVLPPSEQPQQPAPQPEQPEQPEQAVPEQPADPGSDVDDDAGAQAEESVGTSEQEQAAAPAPRRCTRAFADADIAYAGRDEDDRLKALLDGQQDRIVLDVAPFAPTRPPAGLRAWIAELQRGGGKVTRQEIRCTRGFGNVFSELASLFGGGSRRAKLYGPIRGYDARFWVDAADGQVRQVELRRRTS